MMQLPQLRTLYSRTTSPEESTCTVSDHRFRQAWLCQFSALSKPRLSSLRISANTLQVQGLLPTACKDQAMPLSFA
jgi:hypothetical protein